VRRYALFYLLREVGAEVGSMGEFVATMRAAGSPAQQLEKLNVYRSVGYAAVVSEEAWDAAVYITLDRATVIRRLLGVLREEQDGGGAGPSSAAGAGLGPTAVLAPADRLGAMFVDACKQRLGDDLLHVPLDSRHTECLLSDRARQATALRLIEAVRQVLTQLGD
jgi:hypothetical protein